MNLLAIDASQASCSVALYYQNTFFSEELHAPRQQTQLVLPMIDRLLSQANTSIQKFDAIVFNRGPGSFTGVRLTASIAQGLAFGGKIGVLPVSSLQALAYQYHQLTKAEHILVCLDARKSEVYYGFYNVFDGIPVLQGTERVGAANMIKAPLPGKWSAVGSGVALYEQDVLDKLSVVKIDHPVLSYTNARYIIELALQLFTAEDVKSADQAVPIYIRDKVTG